MCTVTFVPAGDKIYITSNRDEKSGRRQALPPRFYIHNDMQLIYPKDEDAGGSWIALNNNGNAAVLLNGAFAKHVPLELYRKSRGLIFLDVIKAIMPFKYFLNMDLSGIEPFTLILLEKNNLYECRWDATMKYYKQLENYSPHIWSSATLYDDEIIKKRESWFSNWLRKNAEPQQADILDFHRFAGDGNKNADLLMNRDGMVCTVSITGIELSNESGTMHYNDLKNKQSYYTQIEFLHSAIQHEYNA